MASKTIIADLNKGDKMNGDNYNLWKLKIHFVLEEQDVLEAVNNVMALPEEGNTAQHRRDMEAYERWKKKDSTARGILISSMHDDLVYKYQQYPTANEMWNALKEMFGGTTVTKLCQLTIKFDTYKKRPNQTMQQHLREMSNMIRELKNAGHDLTNEQQVQAVIRSLPNNWEHLKINLTHNDNIKTFDDAARHVTLEDERLDAIKPQGQAYVAESSSHKASGSKRKNNGKKKGNEPDSKKNKNGGKKKGKRFRKKKDKSKLKCFNCDKMGHFARECSEPKKVSMSFSSYNFAYVTSTVLLADSNPMWTVDSGATDHVAKDRGAYVEYRRIPEGTRWIYVGDNNKVEVKGIGTCKLNLRGGQTLYLHDVLYAPEIRWNLVSVTVLLGLGFSMQFHNK